MKRIIAFFFGALCLVQGAVADCPLDMGCIAGRFLNVHDGKNGGEYHEWSSSSGESYAVGNTIVIRVRFDDESIRTIQSNRNFGIEVEAVLRGENRNIPLDAIYSTFPSSAIPGTDTNVLDEDTNDKNSVVHAVHLLNPSALEAERDYYVTVVFKDNLPKDGVDVVVNLQITIDMNSLSVPFGPVSWATIESIPWLDQFEYYVLETDSHRKYTAFPTGNLGICWDNKEDSYSCILPPGICPMGYNDRAVGFARFAFALIGVSEALAGESCSASNAGSRVPSMGSGVRWPQESWDNGQESVPNPKTNLKFDTDVIDLDGNELYAGRDTLGPMTVKIRVQAKAEHDDAGNWADPGKDKIEIDYFVRFDGGDWIKINRGYMTIGKLDEGRMIQETFVYTIPNVNTTRVEFKTKGDAEDEVDESDEGDNASRIESFAYENLTFYFKYSTFFI